MTGYTSAEVIGRNPRLLKSGQTPATTYQSLWQQLNRGESWRGEFINQKKNGEIFWEDVNIAPLRNDQGTLTHYVAIKHDISEQRRLQIELKESNDRLNLATRAGGVGIWDYNAVNATMVWDDQMLRLHGLTPEQFSNRGTSWIQSIHPEDRLRYTTTFERALTSAESFELEFRVIWPNGSIHEIKALAVVFRDARNRPHRVCGTHWDITREKSTVAALLSSESLLQSVLESTPLGLLVVNHPTSEIINFNNRFCQIWSLETLSAPMRRGEITYRDLLAHCSQRLADAPAFMAGNTAWSDPLPLETLECEIACVQNQTIRYFSTPIPDGDPRKHRRLHVYEDITLKKRHAAEIATSLEKANLVAETRARFISTISHEFRTPMTAAMAAATANTEPNLREVSTMDSVSRSTSGVRWTALDDVDRR
jgi:PAS domain S-box-containing protein